MNLLYLKVNQQKRKGSTQRKHLTKKVKKKKKKEKKSHENLKYENIHRRHQLV
jgi:hypothetical protein